MLVSPYRTKRNHWPQLDKNVVVFIPHNTKNKGDISCKVLFTNSLMAYVLFKQNVSRKGHP